MPVFASLSPYLPTPFDSHCISFRTIFISNRTGHSTFTNTDRSVANLPWLPTRSNLKTRSNSVFHATFFRHIRIIMCNFVSEIREKRDFLVEFYKFDKSLESLSSSEIPLFCFGVTPVRNRRLCI